MPQARLQFELPEEEPEFRHALCGQDYFAALESLAEAFRAKAKYAEGTMEWQDAKDLFWHVLQDANITLE